MTPFLLPIAASIYLVASLLAGASPALPSAALAAALVSLAPGRRPSLEAAERAGALAARLFPYALPLLSLALTLFYAWLWGNKGHFLPVVHDEFAYLFQAKTFLAGRLFYPTPPDPLFFDAFHILTTPVYAAKYPPGHALFLLPGVAAGAPWLMPLVAGALSLLLVGLLARPIAGAAGSLGVVLLFGLSPAELQAATSYLSQTTWLFAALLSLFLLRRSARGGGAATIIGAGFAFAFAALTRPLNGLVLGAWIVLVLLASPGARRALVRPAKGILFLLPLLLTGLGGAAYDRAITGSWRATPWAMYAAVSQPEDRFGFYGGETIEERAVGPGKRIYNRKILYPNRTRYTPRFALRSLFTIRIPMSTWEAVPPLFLVFLLPLFARRRPAAPALLGAAFLFLAHGAYLFYWFPWGRYYHEITVVLVLLPLLGAREVWMRARAGGRAGPAMATLLLVALVFGLSALRLPFQIDFRERKAAYHTRFARLVERKMPPGSILFVRYGPRHNPDLDLIHNEPDLDRSARIFVYDLGAARNRSLVEEHFPERKPFLYEEARWRVLPGFGE